MLLSAVLVAAAATATSCTVPTVGSTGVGVDAAGQPVGYLWVCDEHIDGASLYDVELGDAGGRGAWASPEAVEEYASWSLPTPEDGWVTEERYGPLEPGREFALYGWTDDNTSSAAHVIFTLDDLAALQPGEVITYLGVRSLDDFPDEVCEGFTSTT